DDLLEDRPQLLAWPAPLGPEVEDHQRRHRGMDDLGLEPLDRFALGFGEAQGRHCRSKLRSNAADGAHMGGWRGGHKRVSQSLAGSRPPMLGARLTSAGEALLARFGVSSERA